MVTIRGYGTYLPLYRIERATIAEQHGDGGGRGETAVPAHDEDVVTLGVAAAKNALAHAALEGTSLGGVYTASTSDRFDERGVAPHIATAIGAGDRTRAADFQGSTRAGTTALIAGRDAVLAGTEPVLVVATDLLRAAPGTDAERTAGAGAAALVLGRASGATDDAGPVATVESVAAETTGFVGRFTPAGDSPVAGDGRFNRERYIDAATTVVDRLDAGSPDRVALSAHDGGWGDRARRAAELEAERHSAYDRVGDLGAAGALVDTALAFEAATPDESIVTVGYGAGGADGIAFRTAPGVERLPAPTTAEYAESKEYVTYASHRANREPAGGSA